VTDALLHMTGIVKDFPGVRALGGVDLDVRAGEVHCLIGQNGAGKSTLIKVLSGFHQPDEGTIFWDGQEASFSTPARAIEHGVATIYQELDLVEHLDVTENVFLGHEVSRAGFSQRARARELVKALLARLGHSEISTTRLVGDLSPANQQIVSMARALSHDTRLLVLDEPSAVLDQQEVDNLFRVIRSLTAEGVAIVYISHRLEEIRQIGDRITVLKDGRTVSTGLAVVDTPTPDLIKLMTGRSIEYVFPPRLTTARDLGEPVLEVRDLSLAGVFKGVDLTVRGGEIVGLAGLVGAGRTALLEALFGLHRPTGEIERKSGIWEEQKSKLYAAARKMLATADDRELLQSKAEFVTVLQAFCDSTRVLNEDFTSKVLLALGRIVSGEQTKVGLTAAA